MTQNLKKVLSQVCTTPGPWAGSDTKRHFIKPIEDKADVIVHRGPRAKFISL